MNSKTRKERSEAGIFPAGDRVVIKPDEIEEEVTKSKIELPDWVRTKYEQGQATGTLVAVGPDAFNHITERVYHVHGEGRKELIEERVRGYSEPFAQVGDRVAFAKYSGMRVKGEDGQRYIILNDEDIVCRVSDSVEFTDLDTRKMAGKVNE
jgi:co-chaperonin GroES (HSP10)